MTASPSPITSPAPSPAPNDLPAYLYEGALFLSKRLGVDRLLIVTADGEPLATFVRTGEGGRFESPECRYGQPTVNVPLVRFARVQLSRKRLGIRKTRTAK